MARSEKPIEFIPTSYRNPPPTKYIGRIDGHDTYLWYITEDEYLRLNKIFRRDFQETGLGGTRVIGQPSPCHGCGKYNEFIDWVWTALMRNVHSREFMFNALAKSRQGEETQHDVYCSECGVLISSRRKDKSEGGAPDIYQAREFKLSSYQPTPRQATSADRPKEPAAPPVTWGRWWLDNTGKSLVKKFGDKVPDSSS